MAKTILIGADINAPLYTFENADITECSCVLSSSMVGDELAIDQFMPVLYNAAYIRVKFVPVGSDSLITSDGHTFMCYSGNTGFLDTVPYGTPIRYFSDGVLMGKFYIQQIKRTAKWYFDVMSVSAIGMMDNQKHYGGLYTGETFEEVAADIIGDSCVFSCSADVAKIRIFGWLPIGTRRSNLHQLLFATGVMLDKDSNGEVYFRYQNTDTQKNVPDNRIYVDAGSIDYTSPATMVNVTEHAYIALSTDQTVTLFDNTDGSGEADNTFVAFEDAPVYSLSTSGGLSIVESGVNYAVVSGTGTLTGKLYTHTTKVISKSLPGVNQAEKAVEVTEATLVSIANSENVAQRVLSYYSASKTISADIVVKDEHPGNLIGFTDPFGEPASAFVASMDIRHTGIMRASCDLIANYVPTGGGNNYTEAVVLTGEGEYTFGADAESAVVVLVAGGSGGSSGGRGTDAENGTALSYEAEHGIGGVPGARGMGGKILSVKLASPGGSTFAYKCGAPGVGGIAGESEVSVPGTEGGETTFGSYTSASGERSETGYVNLFTGEVYALPGQDGVAGGDGCNAYNAGSSISFGGQLWSPGRQGASYRTSAGSGDGGYGGGPAVGSNGENGGDGRANSNGGYGGTGGDGAVPIHGEKAVSLGSGGSGGHGGGGGGNGGEGSGPEDKDRMSNGSPGNGAPGSNGGDGAHGCIIIYLRKGGN